MEHEHEPQPEQLPRGGDGTRGYPPPPPIYPPPGQRHEVALRISGRVDFHVHVHFDHASLAAKLRESTNDLRDAVEAAQPSLPVPS